jgi:cytochrome c oxidase assembly protein Cox11
MKKQKLAILALVWAIAVVTVSYALFTLYEYYKPRTFYDNGVTDEEYITITNQTLEAKKFLEKYPNAVIQVDRSGRL